jgi:hypothetical protein
MKITIEFDEQEDAKLAMEAFELEVHSIAA